MTSSSTQVSPASLDRMAALRRDEGWLAAKLADPATLFVPVCQGRSLLTNQNGIVRPAYLTREELGPCGVEDSVFLGVDGGACYFAVELPPPALEAKLKGGLVAFADLRRSGLSLESSEGALLGFAKAMLYWRSQHRFCGKCGAKNLAREGGHLLACPDPTCGTLNFPRTDPAIIVLVTLGDKCLLGSQAAWPKGMYSCLAGFVEPGESLEAAVAREVMEEAGISISSLVYHSSQPWPFPCSLMLGFHAVAASSTITLNDRELEDARWFSRQDLERFTASGEITLPASTSISRALITSWVS